MQFLKKNKDVKIYLIFLIIFCAVFSVSIMSKKNFKEEIKNEEVASTYETLKITQEDTRVVPDNPRSLELFESEESYFLTEPGDYILSGTFNKTLYIDVEEKVVHLFFDNVEINSSEGAAICVVSAAKVIITLLPNTKNTLIDLPIRESNTNEKATIMSLSDITINGSGELLVYGRYKEGIRTKDVLKVLGGDIILQSKGDGLRGNDGILVKTNNLKIESEGNGLYTTDTGKRGKGMIEIAEGNISIIAGNYGISSASDINIYNCQIAGKGVRKMVLAEGNSFIEEGCINNE